MGIDDESSHPELCSEVAGSVTRTIVCLFREPDAGNPPVRFDEREEETELCQTGLRRRGESPANRHREANVTAPLLDSTPKGPYAPPNLRTINDPVGIEPLNWWGKVCQPTMYVAHIVYTKINSC